MFCAIDACLYTKRLVNRWCTVGMYVPRSTVDVVIHRASTWELALMGVAHMTYDVNVESFTVSGCMFVKASFERTARRHRSPPLFLSTM